MGDASQLLARLSTRLAPAPTLDAMPREVGAITINGDHILNPEARPAPKGPLIPAAVLVPLIAYPEGFRVLFTRRTEQLARHSGQIAFPGGRVDDCDGDLIDCALRETEEEVGLDRRFVSVQGALDAYATVTGFVVMPIVATVRPGFTLTPDAREVAEIFEVPLGFLLDPANHQKHSGMFDGIERHWWAMPYGDHYIWGATAGMLRNLYLRLNAAC